MHKNKFFILGGQASRDAIRLREAKHPYSAGKAKLLSLFTGAMGLDLGLESAGFDVRLALELDATACETIRLNRPGLPVVASDIRQYGGVDLCALASLSSEDVTLVVGGPPCPSFSTAGRRQSFADPRGEVMFDFLRIVSDIRPPFFVMENVRGILSAALQHRPLDERGNGIILTPDETPGSVLRLLNQTFVEMGYTVTAELVNAADYGVPQVRERVIFFGSREGFQMRMPPGHFARRPTLFQDRWRTLRDAVDGLDDPSPEFQPFSEARLRYLRLLRAGENWRCLPPELIPEAMGGAHGSDGGKVGFYRRLSWDKPSPTVPTSPGQKSTCLCHPDELRPLSVKEYGRVQQFPDDWLFAGSMAAKYRQIGNAVPVGLGDAIGRTVLQYADGKETI